MIKKFKSLPTSFGSKILYSFENVIKIVKNLIGREKNK